MKIIFVNGVKTSHKDVLKITQRLSNMFGQAVDYSYNPSMSFTSALIESAYNRWHYLFRVFPDTPQVKRLAERIEAIIQRQPQEVVLIGHSQGCVLAINALNRLSYNEKYYCSAILFAPTNTQEPEGLRLVEYFLNEKDWVIKLLPGNYIQKGVKWIKGLFGETKLRKHGRIYMRDGSGHFLSSDYLDELEGFVGFPSSKMAELFGSQRRALAVKEKRKKVVITDDSDGSDWQV